MQATIRIFRTVQSKAKHYLRKVGISDFSIKTNTQDLKHILAMQNKANKKQ